MTWSYQRGKVDADGKAVGAHKRKQLSYSVL